PDCRSGVERLHVKRVHGVEHRVALFEELRFDELRVQIQVSSRPQLVTDSFQKALRMHGMREHMLATIRSNRPSNGIENSSKSIGHCVGKPYTSWMRNCWFSKRVITEQSAE